MEKRKDLYKDGKLDLVFIAGGELNLDTSIAGTLRRYISNNHMDIYGLATLVCAREGNTNNNRLRETREAIEAIHGQRLREVRVEDIKRIFSILDLESHIYLPLVEIWKDRLTEEMKKQGCEDFSDSALEQYMIDRILEELCRK